MSRGALNAAQRLADLEDLRDGPPLDVLVVGGGVTGAGVALDAATRGLRVGLVERLDCALKCHSMFPALHPVVVRRPAVFFH